MMLVLNKPEQNLKRDLQGIASDLKWSAVELMRIAERLSLAGNEADAQAVLRMCTVESKELRKNWESENIHMDTKTRLRALPGLSSTVSFS